MRGAGASVGRHGVVDGVSTAHGAASHDGQVLLVVDRGFGIEAFLGSDMAQGGIVGGLLQVGGGRMGARVVADEMEVLAGGGGDTKGLLHQAVGLISVAIGAFVSAIAAVVVTTAGALGGFPGSRNGALRYSGASSLAFHLAIREKAARHATGAPGLAVRPAAHAGFSLIPDKDGPRADQLPFFLGQSTLDAREKTNATGLEEDDGVRRSADMAVVRLHPPSVIGIGPRNG